MLWLLGSPYPLDTLLLWGLPGPGEEKGEALTGKQLTPVLWPGCQRHTHLCVPFSGLRSCGFLFLRPGQSQGQQPPSSGLLSLGRDHENVTRVPDVL